MGYNALEKMFISKGGTSAIVGRALHKRRMQNKYENIKQTTIDKGGKSTYNKTKVKTTPLPANIDPSSPLGQVLLQKSKKKKKIIEKREQPREQPIEKEKIISEYIKSKGGLEKYKKSFTSEQVLEVAQKYASKGGIYGGKIDEKFWREYAWEEISKTPMERKEQYYDKLPAPARWYSAAFKSTISSASFPITLPQTAIKYIRGKGKLTDPFERISTGKTMFLPDVAQKIQKYAPPSPSGIISVGVSEGIGKVTGHEVGELKRAKKYPIETMFATGGELLGLLIGGKAVSAGKVTIGRGLSKAGVPEFPLKYRPVQIVRKGYWKLREKAGNVKEVKDMFNKEALPSGLSYAPGKTPAQRISATIKAFEKTKVDGGYVGIHASKNPWIKPLAWLRKGRESPGLSVAPVGEGAPRFLRITGRQLSYDTSGVSLMPQVRLPTAPLFYFKKLKTKLVSATAIKKEGGGFIAPKMFKGGGEYEAILRGVAKRGTTKQFSIVEGVVVPHPEFQLIEKIGGVTARSALKNSIKGFISPYSYGKTTIPILSPSYLVSSAGSYSPPSIPSYPSKPSMPSYSPPSIPSYPSKSSYPKGIVYSPSKLDNNIGLWKKDVKHKKRYMFRKFDIPSIDKILKGGNIKL